MKRFLILLAVFLSLPIAALVVYVFVLYLNGTRGVFPPESQVHTARRPDQTQLRAARSQQRGRTLVGRSDEGQILFGDLHVHTVYSADAHLQAINIRDREGLSPPADACDFARFCSQLDFWSINDHAESLTPDLWRRTVDAIRECNAVAGDPAAPDLVSFLGWEWSHSASRAAEHYGHKNVVLLDIEPGKIPTRPIASSPGPPNAFLTIGFFATLLGETDLSSMTSFHRYALDTLAVDDCPDGVPVRELSADCRESASNPKALFAKLADWGFPAIVIPHGLAWGTTNPAHVDLANQLGVHDPRWQRLLEVYSGHGNSEIYRDFTWPIQKADGHWTCPPATADFEPCCQRAATLARQRCSDPESDDCKTRVEAARQHAADTWGGLRSPLPAVEGTTLADWGDCGQLRNSFLAAWNYRPRQSAQYGYALGTKNGRETEARFRWGLIGASDIHRSRPGTGYAERARQRMTDGAGYPIPNDFMDSRSGSFFFTGGLAAVHAGGRDRRFDLRGTAATTCLRHIRRAHPAVVRPAPSRRNQTADGLRGRARSRTAFRSARRRRLGAKTRLPRFRPSRSVTAENRRPVSGLLLPPRRDAQADHANRDRAHPSAGRRQRTDRAADR